MQTAATEPPRVRAPRADARRRRFSSLFGRATELGAFREGEHSRLVLERDARFRRALATADVLAMALVFAAVLAASHSLPAPGRCSSSPGDRGGQGGGPV